MYYYYEFINKRHLIRGYHSILTNEEVDIIRCWTNTKYNRIAVYTCRIPDEILEAYHMKYVLQSKVL